MSISTSDLDRLTGKLFESIGTGSMENTAYDTACVARLADKDATLSYQAVDWLAEHQLPDGSWGNGQMVYYHDRVICTLAACLALASHGRRGRYRARWENGLAALEVYSAGASKMETASINDQTVGFEMIVPTLLADAEALGIIRHRTDRRLGPLAEQRAQKLSFLKGKTINRYVSMAHPAEMAGPDALSLLDIVNLQSPNGSISVSPSATAYFANYVRPGDAQALQYLRSVMSDGGVPNVAPLDVFERSWVLWNLALANALTPANGTIWQPHLDHLRRSWRPGQGVGFSAECSLVESDDSSMTFEVLTRLGAPPDLDTILGYEDTEHFRCFPLELNPSLSANIPVLGALRQAGLEVMHPVVQKVAQFLRRNQSASAFWADKWHVSPYYATAHAIIACAGYCDELVRGAVDWVLGTQNPDGAWGYYMPTAEETAYCIQALSVWNRHQSHPVVEPVRSGAAWLADHYDDGARQPLWIGKCMYYPGLVVQSAVLSALYLAAQ